MVDCIILDRPRLDGVRPSRPLGTERLRRIMNVKHCKLSKQKEIINETTGEVTDDLPIKSPQEVAAFMQSLLDYLDDRDSGGMTQ